MGTNAQLGPTTPSVDIPILMHAAAMRDTTGIGQMTRMRRHRGAEPISRVALRTRIATQEIVKGAGAWRSEIEQHGITPNSTVDMATDDEDMTNLFTP